MVTLQKSSTDAAQDGLRAFAEKRAQRS